MSHPIDRVLPRLEGVKKTGPDRWMARCSGHPDRTGSLSLRALEDGRVLVHCFAGCSVDQVVAGAGLLLEDLFPPKQEGDRRPRERRPFVARDAILALRRELHVAWVILADVAAGKELTDFDRKRAGIARDRCVALITELADD